jgi:hypothetical protein
MTLIVALQTSDDKIVMAADGMNVTFGDGLGSSSQYAYRNRKINPVKSTDWTMALSGLGSMSAFQKRLETEVDLGIRPPFDPHIEIGGPEYLNELIRLTRAVYADERNSKEPFSPTLLAGFDIERKPQVLAASLPRPGYFIAPKVFVLGAQEETATWIIRVLGGCCTTLEDVKKLAYFTIWQISKQDLRVGSIESGYPIDLCVMSAESPTHFEELSKLPSWMINWETNLQTCFMNALRAKEKGDSV